jgi:hypothetical protein
MRHAFALVCVLAVTRPVRGADGPPEKKDQPRAPADYVIVDEDRVGAYFVARPLKEKYDALLKRLAVLRDDIAAARIDSAKARSEIDAIAAELATLRGEIDRVKLYIPGAPVHTVTVSETFPLAVDDLLLIDGSDLEIRGWDRPEVKCLIEKTALGEDAKQVADDFAGIVLEHRRAPAKEFFGFYEGLDKNTRFAAEWERFPFKDFLGHDVIYVTLKGLTGQEGNKSISLKMLNEEGAGTHASRWRRHARMTLFVPRCRRVGVRGALGGFKVRSLEAPLSVQGEGDRDYAAIYEVSGLGGPLDADNIAIHRLDGIRGNVSVVATAYPEDTSTTHDDRGITMSGAGPRPSTYRNIQGALRVRSCRADLTIERVSGRVDVANDFGSTTWLVGEAPSKADHRVVSESGSIKVQIGQGTARDLGIHLFSECGTVYFPKQIDAFEPSMFTSGEGDTVRRSWHGFVVRPGREKGGLGGFELFERVAAALHGRPRTPGIDVISRAGTITVVAP